MGRPGADRDCVTIFPDIVDGIHAFTLRPGDKTEVEVTAEKDAFTDVVAAALNLPHLRIVSLGREAYADERQQWDSGNNLVAVSIYLHFSAPLRSLPWMLLVLFVAFAGQAIGDVLFDGQISGSFGAAAMTPVVLWVERLPNGPPKLVTFLPAFWLLVPGATGLIGVAQIVGTGFDVTSRALSDVLITIISISLGVLIGAAAHRSADAGFRRLSGTSP